MEACPGIPWPILSIIDAGRIVIEPKAFLKDAVTAAKKTILNSSFYEPKDVLISNPRQLLLRTILFYRVVSHIQENSLGHSPRIGKRRERAIMKGVGDWE